MKLKYIKSVALGCVIASLTGCNDNSWNDTFLDGFDGEVSYNTTVNVDYTLTNSDYETIGKALVSIATTTEETAAAQAIQANHYFDQNGPFKAQMAVPYLLNQNQSDFYIYNVGSTVNVSLMQAETPAEVIAISAAKTLSVDYGTSSSSIASKLKSEFPDAVDGDFAIVTIKAEENNEGGEGENDKPQSSVWTVTEALAQMSAGYEGEATVKGIVSSIQELSTSYGNATYFIKDNLSDEASLEVFRGYYLDNEKFSSEDQLQVGATVTVTGNLVNYNGTFEFTNGNYITSYEAPATKSRAEALTDNIKNLSSGQTLTATAVVTAQSGRGLILTDNAGSIFYYDNNVDLNTYSIGTIVNVSGQVSEYGTGYQLPNTATLAVVGSETYTYPTPTTYTASMIESAISSTTLSTAQYVTYEGTLSISGNYYNINIPGVSNGQGSLYTPTDDLKDKLVDGNTYKFTGYFTGVTSGKYFYMVLTDAVESTGGSTGGNTGGDNTGGSGNTGGDNSGNNSGSTTSEPQYALYQYNGSAWAVAEGAGVMQPSGYTSMGQTVDKITEPAIYLPIYMKNAYPYEVPGTEMYLAYNVTSTGASCALMKYDGYNWDYVDNYIENKVAQFVKTETGYTFRKYLGEEVFTFYDQDKLALNCSYLIVYSDLCMNPVTPNANDSFYGYPGETQISINEEGQIVMSSDYNAFTFTTTTEYNGTVYTAPEGYFMIMDSYGNYAYNNNYSSLNMRKLRAYITDNEINPQYLWSAKKNDDGTWSITNTSESSAGVTSTRTLYYSDGNNDFAIYQESDLSKYNGRLPYLYISETSTPDLEDSGIE